MRPVIRAPPVRLDEEAVGHTENRCSRTRPASSRRTSTRPVLAATVSKRRFDSIGLAAMQTMALSVADNLSWK